MTKFYVTAEGTYIGAFDGTYVPGEPAGEDEDGNVIPGEPVHLFPEIPAGAIEVPSAPDDARQLYDFLSGAWLAIPRDPAEALNQYRAAIQQHVDAVAQARHYDGGVSLASYVASSNPAWAAEAQAFVAWRDAVWAHAYAELDRVLAGQREQPGVEAFLGELPVIEWPD